MVSRWVLGEHEIETVVVGNTASHHESKIAYMALYHGSCLDWRWDRVTEFIFWPVYATIVKVSAYEDTSHIDGTPCRRNNPLHIMGK